MAGPHAVATIRQPQTSRAFRWPAAARSLARALAAQPSILLLDEPFSALDHLTRADLYMLLAELKQELNIPIILVTHNLEEARLLADKMAVMYQGRILQVGTPASVMQQPNQRQVATIVGMQNIFNSQVLDVSATGARISWVIRC